MLKNNFIRSTTVNKFAWIITGLIQSDGSFFVKIFTSPKSSKFSIQPCLTISLTMRTSSTEVPKSEGSSLLLLQSIQQFLGCGFIFIDNKRNMCTFTVSDLNSLWNIILPHFCKYPLIGSKHSNFLIFVEILILLYPWRNKTKPSLVVAKCLQKIWEMNKNNRPQNAKRSNEDLSELLKKINVNSELKPFSILDTTSLTILNPVSFLNSYFLIGIIEGDGSFYIGLRPNRKLRFGFNITTHIDDLDLLYRIKFFLNCGLVRVTGKNHCRYEIEGTKQLINILVPLVQSIGLIGAKSINFHLFKEALHLYANNEHKTEVGFNRILKLAYSTPQSDKNKKLTISEYLERYPSA